MSRRGSSLMRLRELVRKEFLQIVLGMGGMGLSVALALMLFEVPLRGSFWVLMLAAALFLLVALGMGLLISIFARSQFVAGQIAIIATFLPAFLLSGFIFDIGSMPTVIQSLTHLVAARYFVAILQSVFLAGNVWSVILPNAGALVIMAFFSRHQPPQGAQAAGLTMRNAATQSVGRPSGQQRPTWKRWPEGRPTGPGRRVHA